MTFFKSGSDPQLGPEFARVPGALVRAIVQRACTKLQKGSPQLFANQSIGLQPQAIVATNGHVCIVLGEYSGEALTTTDRRVVLIEAARADEYVRGFNADAILPVEGEFDPDNDPPLASFPNPAAILSTAERTCEPVAVVPVQVLIDLAAILQKSTSRTVKLFLPRDHSLLRFEATHYTEEPEFGESPIVPIQGVFALTSIAHRRDEEDADESPSDTTVTARTSDGETVTTDMKTLEKAGRKK